MQTKQTYPEAGNWHEFDSFIWFKRPDDADDFCIYHLNHRNSGLLDQSNADIIREALKPFDNDVLFMEFSHWAAGWINAVAVRVNTEAYKTLCGIIDRLSEYPVLDEMEYCEREYEATLENIKDSFYQVKEKIDKNKLPEDWSSYAHTWFGDNDQSAVESVDDQGGYPNHDQLLECISSLWPEAVNTK